MSSTRSKVARKNRTNSTADSRLVGSPVVDRIDPLPLFFLDHQRQSTYFPNSGYIRLTPGTSAPAFSFVAYLVWLGVALAFLRRHQKRPRPSAQIQCKAAALVSINTSTEVPILNNSWGR